MLWSGKSISNKLLQFHSARMSGGKLAPMRLGLTPTYTISSLSIEYSLGELGMGKKGDR